MPVGSRRQSYWMQAEVFPPSKYGMAISYLISVYRSSYFCPKLRPCKGRSTGRCAGMTERADGGSRRAHFPISSLQPDWLALRGGQASQSYTRTRGLCGTGFPGDSVGQTCISVELRISFLPASAIRVVMLAEGYSGTTGSDASSESPKLTPVEECMCI